MVVEIRRRARKGRAEEKSLASPHRRIGVRSAVGVIRSKILRQIGANPGQYRNIRRRRLKRLPGNDLVRVDIDPRGFKNYFARDLGYRVMVGIAASAHPAAQVILV